MTTLLKDIVGGLGPPSNIPTSEGCNFDPSLLLFIIPIAIIVAFIIIAIKFSKK